ncbi:CPBP family intramembrane glutamic endopeptidase [Saccharicrinis sp. FJH62]|uniref:CPBP family intramembrane glutamic endopeptidase n=1 Tax=Saccharicrinis sp. FJH62 TaxID=3344657 RepID=UPI0035D41A01
MDSNYRIFWIVLLSSVILLVIYSVFFIEFNRKSKSVDNKRSATFIYLQRLTGVITFGIFPIGIMNYTFSTGLEDYGAALVMPYRSLLWFIILSVIIIPLNFFQARKDANLNVYPQIRIDNWNIGVFTLSAVTWILYLLAYEFFFRGFLLFAAQDAVGPYWAVVINTVLYAMAHIPKGKFETIGAIPLGILLCIITFNTGSFWVAFGMHVVMALSNEWFSLYYHKEMKVTFLSKSDMH